MIRAGMQLFYHFFLLSHKTHPLKWGGGVGGQGGLNLPLPVPFNPGSRPVFFSSRPFAFFRLRNIAQCCIIFPFFSRFPPPWESRFPPPLLPPPVHLPPPFLPVSRPPVPPHSEDELAKYITDSNNVAKEELVKSVCVYSLQEHADLFAAEKGISESDEVPIQLAEEFISSLSISDEQIQIINEQTLGQSESQFWFAQRAGRVTASSFYTVCHLRDTTDRRNTVKNLMNYCPLNSDSAPEQLVWGHEKETVAINQYLKKTSKKHKSVTVDRSGLIVAKSMPFLGASPDGIRKCGCCPQKTTVEAKSLYSKRNLLPAVAAAAFLEEDDEGNLKLKSETKWNYQIKGLMGISEIHDADLVIYTNKGILIIPVPFDESLWNQMKSKLRAFYVNYMVEELITKKIFKSLCK